MRGVVGSSGSARSGPEGLLPRVNLANPLSYAPRPRRKGKGRGRGTEGGDANLPCPPFFLWGELFLLLLVRGEGKYEGAGAPHCAPGRYTYSAVVYASRFPYAMHTPVDVTGIEPARDLCLQGLGLSTFDTHPTILFWLGNRRPRDGRTDALCWPSASGSRGARPEPSF